MSSHDSNAGFVSSNMEQMLQKLREDFDSAFQQPRESATADQEGLLLIRVREEPVALRLSELGGVHECPAITRVPSRYPAQLGLIGVRSNLVTAYSLAAFIAQNKTSHSGNWIAISARDRSLGFVFDKVEAYVQVRGDGIARRRSAQKRQHSSGTIRTGEVVRSVVDTTAIAETIRQRLAEAKSKLE